MRCPKCGHDTPDDSIFCEFCGTRLKWDERKSKNRVFFLIALNISIIVGIISIIVGFYFYNYKFNITERNEKETDSLIVEIENNKMEIFPTKKEIISDEFVLIEAGTLRNYGYVYELDDNYVKQTVENIKLDDFYISKYDVIQGDYEKLMHENPSLRKNDSFPIMGISFMDALKYCNELSKKNGYDGFYEITGDSVLFKIHGNGYRLPTQYEYAFAARDRKDKAYKYAAGNNLSEIAWHAGNSKGTVHKIAQKKPNELGLYDMVGNVYKFLWSDDKRRINVCCVGGSYGLYSYSLYTFRENFIVGGGEEVGIRLVFIPKYMECGNIQTNHWCTIYQR